VDLVSVFAGDRAPSEEEKILLDGLKKERGKQFYSDLLYSITHLYIPPEIAENRWNEIIQHKSEMSKALNRNVRIIVATLDYLSNFKHGMLLPTLVGEAHIAAIVGLSMHDGLTGLFNHISCFEIIDLELKRFARYGTVVSLIIADIDNFKTVNDQFGHQEGDKALIQLATVFKRETRDSDICCRYGGEEFAAILPMTDVGEAAEIAERIRVETMHIRVGDRSLTVCLGVASCDEKTTTSYALVRKADRALYKAKTGKWGKNWVEVI
jgi:diguanylate cyclase (GGDEF)-like protein